MCKGILLGKPNAKKSLGIPKRRWDDNIKMDLKEVGCEGMDWIDLAQDTSERGNESSGSIKCGEFLDKLRTDKLLKKESSP